MRMPALGLSVMGLLTASAAHGEPNCMTRVVLNAPAQEAPEEVMSKGGSHFGPITKMKVNRRTGRLFYCGERTYCYDSNALEMVTPCRVKLDKAVNDSGFFVYFTR